LGGLNSGPGKTGPTVELTNPHLTFANTRGPTSPFDKQLPPDREAKMEGHHDFWFTNENADPVELYVAKVSCNRCLSIKGGLAPEGVKEEQEAGNDVTWQGLETEEMKENAKGFTVPAKRGGWVRMTWKDEDPGPKILSTDLRTTCPRVGNAPNVRL